MNFARRLEQAERTARRLLWLHLFVSLTVVIAVDALATLCWHLLFGAASEPPAGFHQANIGLVLALIVGGGWIETARLREDSALIARRLGAVPVDTVSDPLHRRLQNLLEELSIAARIGVPRGFVLEDEPSINALTAGMDRNRSVVVVTRGALLRLTRDELQGVLAHELSHVVNGDVRLNTRLLGMNHGLQWVALFGRSLIARGAIDESVSILTVLRVIAALPLVLVGLVFAGVGAIGELAARAVQAGVGRQREYVADAQAIAFTRSRDGLGGALRKVAGLPAQLRREAEAAGTATRDPRREAALRHPYWQNVAHLLLIGSVASRRWFETHPSLRERVHRIYARDMAPLESGTLTEPQRREPDLPALEIAAENAARYRADDGPEPALTAPPLRAWQDTIPGDEPVLARDTGGRAGAAGLSLHSAPQNPPAVAHDPVGAAHDVSERDPVIASAALRLVQATRESADAAALVVALIETPAHGEPVWSDGWHIAAARHGALRAAVAALPEETLRTLRWPLIELAVARLQALSRPCRETLLATLRGVVEADARLTLREWIHFSLLRTRLRLEPGPAALRLARDPAEVRGVRVLFALVAHCANASEARADRAANAAIRALDLEPIGGSPGSLTLDALEQAVRYAARLPPLKRPLLVRHLAALLGSDGGSEGRDFLRLLCVAIDCPPPLLAPRVRGRRARSTSAAVARVESAAQAEAEASDPELVGTVR